LFLLVYGTYFLVRYEYYGYLLPNTFYIKTGSWLNQAGRGGGYVFLFIFFFQAWNFIPALVFTLRRKIDFSTGYLSLSALAYVSYMVSIGGDWMPLFRLMHPVLAHLYLLVAFGFWEIYSLLVANPIKSRRISLLAWSVFAVLLLLSANVNLLLEDWELLKLFQEENHQWISVGKCLKAHSLRNESISLMYVGALAYYSELRVYDLLGITDTHIAHLDYPWLGLGFPGHEKQDFAYIMQKNSTYVLLWKPNMTESPLELPCGIRYGPYESVSSEYEGRYCNYCKRT